jgi:hypothetical protein
MVCTTCADSPEDGRIDWAFSFFSFVAFLLVIGMGIERHCLFRDIPFAKLFSFRVGFSYYYAYIYTTSAVAFNANS